MIFLSILILIVAIALPSIHTNIRTILYLRISSIIFIYAGALAFNALYIQSIGSGIGIYSGLFQVTFISQGEVCFNTLFLAMLPITTNNNNKRKSIKSKIWYGIKSGWELPVLPAHIAKLDEKLYIKIFKFIGGFCVFIIVSGIGAKLNNKVLFYAIFVFSLFYIFYKYVIAFYVIKQWFIHLKSGNFIVRNSPFELLTTVIRASAVTLKATTKFTIATGMTYALCYELDEILIQEGKDAYFVPGMRAVIASTGFETHAKTFLDKLGIRDRVSIEDTDSVDNFLDNLSQDQKSTFETSTGFKFEDFRNAHKEMLAIKNGKTSVSESAKELLKSDPFGKNK